MSDQRLRNLLSQRFGFSLDQIPPGFLAAWRAEARRQGVNSDELAGRVDGRGWDDWLSRLTVPETYFFRHRPQMEMLRQHVLPRLQRQPAIRIWSAGCCTGEEAYTLALLCHQQGWAQRAQIWASDLNPEALEVARRGVYGANSFREGGRELCEELPGKQWRVPAAIRRMVTFQTGNLLEETRPGQHLILCRNVLIYLDESSRRRVLDNLAASLEADGTLMVAPCEGGDFKHPRLRTVRLPQGLLFERGEPVKAAPPTRPRPTPPPRRPLAAVHSRQALPVKTVPPTLAQAQACGDRGDYRRAEELCRQLLQAEPHNLGALFLQAHLADVQGDRDEYRLRLERILYDDPHAAGAYLELAQLHQSLGRETRAERCREAARDVLRQLAAGNLIEPYGTPAGVLLAELESR